MSGNTTQIQTILSTRSTLKKSRGKKRDDRRKENIEVSEEEYRQFREIVAELCSTFPDIKGAFITGSLTQK